MSVNLQALWTQQFATNMELLLQQKMSRLRGKVMEGSHKGEQASPVDQLGAIEMLEVVDRYSPMRRVDGATDRRWVLPTSFELPQLVDTFDELKALIDPKSKMVQNALMAANRKIDSVLLAAMFGNAKTGKTGSTDTPFDSNYAVAVNHEASSNVGLTVAKLRAARKILMANEVDLESDPVYFAGTATQFDNLLQEAQVISLDYNERPVLKDGKLERFLGMTAVHTELVPFSTYRLVPVWAKSGMHLGVWGDIHTSISQRHDLTSEPWQAYVKLTVGGTRLEEKKVVKISCAE